MLQIPTKVAIGINLVPTKLAIVTNKLAQGDGTEAQDKNLLIGDVFPLPEAAPEAAAA